MHSTITLENKKRGDLLILYRIITKITRLTANKLANKRISKTRQKVTKAIKTALSSDTKAMISPIIEAKDAISTNQG